MAFQLTILPHSDVPEQVLQPGRVLTFPTGPVLVGGSPRCHCRLPGSNNECLRITGSGDKYTAESLPASTVSLNQKILTGMRELRSGDLLEVSGQQIRFFLVYPRVNYSWQSNALANLAKISIALVLVLQFALMFILPELLKDGDFWHGQQMRLTIIDKTDDLRQDIRKIDSNDPIVQALLLEYEQELLGRTRYLRSNAERMNRRQRPAMLAALNRIENDIRLLQNIVLTQPPPQLNLEQPVTEIIEKISYE